eukprot:8668208-Pyramimonas_sp.AAC.2
MMISTEAVLLIRLRRHAQLVSRDRAGGCPAVTRLSFYMQQCPKLGPEDTWCQEATTFVHSRRDCRTCTFTIQGTPPPRK